MADEQTLTPPPIHHWTMDNITGATVNDEMGNTNLTNTGMVAVPGVFNNGLSASGSSANRLTADSAISFKTITMRISRSSLANYTNILMSSDGQHVLAINPNNVATFNAVYIWNSGSVYETDLPIADTDWHFLVIREQSDGNAHDVYLDGVWSTTYLNTGLGGEFLYLGRSNEVSGQEVANFDDVQIYDRKLTDAEIRELFLVHTVPFRNLFDQSYDLLLPYYRAVFNQDYSLLASRRAVLDQIFSLIMIAAFEQPITDAKLLREILDQRYGDAPFLRRLFDQPILDTYKYRNDFDQVFNLQAGLKQAFIQRWSVSQARYIALCNQAYDLQDKDLLRQLCEQVYVLAAGMLLIQRPQLKVVCDGVQHHAFNNLEIEEDESLWYMTGELHFPVGKMVIDGVEVDTVTEYSKYTDWGNQVVITVDGVDYHYITEIPRMSRPGIAQETYIVPLRSETILLGAPHNQQTAATWQGMASDLVAALAAPFTVDWQLEANWFIPEGILTGTGQSAIDVIKQIVVAAGGLVQTEPDGTLVCRPEYPVSVDKWDTETPFIELTDQDDFFSINPSIEIRPGYNKFYLTDQQSGSGGESIKSELIAPNRALVKVYNTPWSDLDLCNLLHSGGSWVSVVADGVVNEEITVEDVEIKNGSGKVNLPFYGLVSWDYNERDLGTITIDESGNVTTDVKDHSLVDISYITKFWRFIATDNQIEKVQFYGDIQRAN